MCDGIKLWSRAGIPHRAASRAIVWPNGDKCWYLYGRYHREGGPAVIRTNGQLEWYIDDTRIHNWERYQQLTNISDEDLTILILKYGEIS